MTRAELRARTTETPSGCWEWTGFREADSGYARLGAERVHRISYRLYKGPIPDGLIVRHRCDNPCCVRPAHLELGTRADNARDRVERGRGALGERHGRAKLTTAQVREIREAPKYRVTARQLAATYGVHPETISRIRTGARWGKVQ